MLEFFHWFTKFIESKSFGSGQSSIYKNNVRQAARPARSFLVTFTSTTVILVYRKTYFSTKTQLRAVPKDEISEFNHLNSKKIIVDESIFLNSKNSELMNPFF